MSRGRPLVIGLTGGVASGKSWVAARFRALGIPLLEADEVGRAVVQAPSPALEDIASAFGREFLLPDGNLDRSRMRERIFSDAGARARLEAITHPLIRRRISDWIHRQEPAYCILAAAILIESGMDRLVDRVLVVDAPQATQIERLIQRDGISPNLAQQMLQAQASREQRLARANDVLDNGNIRLSLEPQIRRLHHFYLELAAAPAEG